MPTIKVSETNKTKLDSLLAKTIGVTGNPNVTMDDVISNLLRGVIID